MAKTTKFSGYVREYNGDFEAASHRFGVTTTISEGGLNSIKIAPGSTDISIMARGLVSAKSVFIDTDTKVNVVLTGSLLNASFNLLANGVFMLNGSLSNVRLSNNNATPTAIVKYNVSG